MLKGIENLYKRKSAVIAQTKSHIIRRHLLELLMVLGPVSKRLEARGREIGGSGVG